MEIAKVLFIGDGGVGKTSLIRKFFESIVAEKLTVGVEFTLFKISDEKSAFIWDIGGEERFEVFTESLMKGAKLVVLVYDVSRTSTLLNLEKWAQKVFQVNNRKIPAIVVGNKIDLGKSVDDDLVKEKLNNLPVITLEHIETSAITGKNVPTLFKKIAELVSREDIDLT